MCQAAQIAKGLDCGSEIQGWRLCPHPGRSHRSHPGSHRQDISGPRTKENQRHAPISGVGGLGPAASGLPARLDEPGGIRALSQSHPGQDAAAPGPVAEMKSTMLDKLNSPQQTIWTVGHSNRSLEEFLHLLRAQRVTLVGDLPPTYDTNHGLELERSGSSSCSLESNLRNRSSCRESMAKPPAYLAREVFRNNCRIKNSATRLSTCPLQAAERRLESPPPRRPPTAPHSAKASSEVAGHVRQGRSTSNRP